MNEIDNTVERIGQLPDSGSWLYISGEPFTRIKGVTTDDLKALATAYTKAIADLATAKQGLEPAQDCLCNACGTSYRLIQDTLDAIGTEDGDGHVCKCCEKPCDCSSHLPCDGCYECQNDPTLQMKF